ncbi:MAG: beta-ketoacyl synthase chain length factor [Sinobacteraceae bacterium]|nr:beta-ketoacyl synthase chain length factor [Nevskiaceae bacterium]
MQPLSAYIEGIGLLGPGFPDWPAAVPQLLDPDSYRPEPTVIPLPEGLPSAERRRLGQVVKLALAVAFQACAAARRDPASLPSVFSSSGGDGHNCHEICENLTQADPRISPTRFHNSVHNAASGYWGIATGATTPSNALCAFDASFAAGLLEAYTQLMHEREPVLLVAYDAQYPPPLFEKRPIPDAFAVAMVLGADITPGALARVSISLAGRPADIMANSRLEELRRAIPAARCLPLLYSLARRKSAAVALEYLDGATLSAEITPCP